MKGHQLSSPFFDGWRRSIDMRAGQREITASLIHLDPILASRTGRQLAFDPDMDTGSAWAQFRIAAQRLDYFLCPRLDLPCFGVAALVQINAHIGWRNLEADPVSFALLEPFESHFKVAPGRRVIAGCVLAVMSIERQLGRFAISFHNAPVHPMRAFFQFLRDVRKTRIAWCRHMNLDFLDSHWLAD